jgi:dihydroxyacetone kinase-like predicted kinase
VLDSLDVIALRRWRAWSIEALALTRREIDSLNVFPVADSDTGSNLYVTLSAQIAPSAALGTVAAESRAMAAAALRGARGSSGVILSQLLRGAADALADSDAGNGPDVGVRGRALAAALVRAADAAYVAVSRPVEGTMLTVAREAARAATGAGTDELAFVVAAAVGAARAALRDTPDQLAVLAEAGVVDAGGRGLVVLLEVLQAVVDGRAMPEFATGSARPLRRRPAAADSAAQEVMYLLDADDDQVPALRTALDLVGEAVVVSGGGGVWNVHVHTDNPDAAIAAGRAVGVLDQVAVRPLADRPVPVIAAAGQLTALAAVSLIAAAGGALSVVVTPSAVAEPTVVIVIGHGATGAGLDAPGTELVEVDSVVQALAALGVHDPHQPVPQDAVSMAAAASATRHVEVDIATAAASLDGMLADSSEIVTLVGGSEEPLRRLAAAVAASRPALTLDVLVAAELGDVVLIGVE